MIDSYNERFKFTTKELDAESGYYYFGARYLLSELGDFLSTDPLTDKTPELSSYMYCNGNPLKYIDPDGRKIVVGTWYGRVLAKLGFNNFESKTQQRLQYSKTVSPELNKAITTMETAKNSKVKISPSSQFYKDYPKEASKGDSWKTGVTAREGSNSSIYYQEDAGFLIDGNYSSPDAILAHELGHADDNMSGTFVVYNHEEAIQGNMEEQLKGNANEKKAITYENHVRQTEGEPARTYDYYTASNEQ